MNYFPFHVGDYAAHTAHLEPMEDLAYRRMLDAYYLRETPLPLDVAEVARLIRMKGHQAEVQAVLTEYFQQTPEGWRHGRCDEEIARMQDKQTKARASAAASVNARKANAQRTLNERSTDVELPTPTPTPTPNTPPTPKGEQAEPAGFVRFWEEWPKSARKGGKAKCLQVWGRARLETQAEAICRHVGSMAETIDWTKEDGAYVPAPLVYLNQRRWDGADLGELHAGQDRWGGAL